MQEGEGLGNIKLPEGWEVKKLGEVSKINYGYTEKASFENVGPKFIRITDIQENYVDWDKVPFCRCSDKNLLKYKLETGDIVFARTGATTGKSYLIQSPPKAVFASYLIKLKINSISKLIPKFVFYFFQTKTYWNKINQGISGSTQGGFNAKKLGELEFHFPKSLSKQHRIVSILDQCFAAISKAKKNAEQNLSNAKELFESYLQGVFDKRGEGWEENKLGEVCEVIAGQSPKGKFYNKEGKGMPFYQGKKEYGEKYIGKPTTWTTKVTKEAKADDILISVRAPVGPLNFATQKICIGRGLAAIRTGEFIDKEFLYYFLLKQENKIEGNIGAVFNSINKTQIEGIKIPLPSLPEQKTIVRQLDALRLETKKLEAIYQKKIAGLEELKKSILQKAFAGTLGDGKINL